jgi:hypothetical protein
MWANAERDVASGLEGVEGIGDQVVQHLVKVVWPDPGGRLTAPGSDSAAARIAEWGRQHRLGWAVTGLERAGYAVQHPRIGGTVAGGIPTVQARGQIPLPSPSVTLPGPAARRPPANRSSRTRRPHSSAPVTARPPAPLKPLARSRLSHEGHWQTLMAVHGLPAIQVAFLRPDPHHTSYLSDIVWMDPHLLSFELFPGIQYSGQPRTGPSHLAGSDRNHVLATFNSGFQLKDSHGGYWQDGKTTQPLKKGAASMVFGTDGSLKVEPWPGGTPGPGVDAVRQSLSMLIDQGHVSALVNNPGPDTWGLTVGNSAYVWRTGIGVRKDGTIVFAMGPALDIQTLAHLLQDAGAVNAMELDINPSWTNFFTYSHPHPGAAIPTRLGTDTTPEADRYLKPCTRDFVTVFARYPHRWGLPM